MKGRVLVAGFATRHVVQSAARAGYTVCAIDHFTDVDLGWYAQKVTRFDDLDELQARVDRAAASDRFDFFCSNERCGNALRPLSPSWYTLGGGCPVHG